MRGTFAVLVLATLVVPGCNIERTGEDRYQVETPTPEAEDAAERVEEGARRLGDEIAEGAEAVAESEAAQELEAGVRAAGQKAGEGLEKAGKELQEHSKPGDQDR